MEEPGSCWDSENPEMGTVPNRRGYSAQERLLHILTGNERCCGGLTGGERTRNRQEDRTSTAGIVLFVAGLPLGYMKQTATTVSSTEAGNVPMSKTWVMVVFFRSLQDDQPDVEIYKTIVVEDFNVHSDARHCFHLDGYRSGNTPSHKAASYTQSR